MTSTTNKASLKEWKNLLQSGKENVIIETIQKLRKEGSCELIKDIAHLYLKNPTDTLVQAVSSFFNDLKEQKCVEPYMEFLLENKEIEYIKEMVCSCWQNGLDHSKFLDFFIWLVLYSDYETAIEAFTVVEENIENTTPSDRAKLLELIDKEFKNLQQEKVALVKELRSVVGIISGPFQMDI